LDWCRHVKIGSLFSGIGGLELGLEMAGLGETVWQVEKDEFCRSVLARHWPDAERFDDVCAVGANNLIPVDLICGGFPCQDVSSLGKRSGLSGARSGLWSEYRRVVSELKPTWVVIENVASGADLWFDSVRDDLGGAGYVSLPIPLEAADVGAPHERARVFIIARDANSNSEPVVPKHGETQAVRRASESFSGWSVHPSVRVDDGLPSRLDKNLRAFGNAVVPQCAEVIGHIVRELAGIGEVE
jgi:DNA (cytosine-5)-methyltransferase 1